MGTNNPARNRATGPARALPPHVHRTATSEPQPAPDAHPASERPPECPRCTTGLFPVELADGEGHKVHALHCILCGTYIEPGHVPDTEVVRTVRGPRGPRK